MYMTRYWYRQKYNWPDYSSTRVGNSVGYGWVPNLVSAILLLTLQQTWYSTVALLPWCWRQQIPFFYQVTRRHLPEHGNLYVLRKCRHAVRVFKSRVQSVIYVREGGSDERAKKLFNETLCNLNSSTNSITDTRRKMDRTCGTRYDEICV
jgi:hypothetical protein